MPARLPTAVLIALSILVVIVSPAAAAELGARAGRGAARALSTGELTGLIIIGFIPALVMILRERRDGGG